MYMTDLGLLCSICLGKDHSASSCPMRSKFRRNGTLVTKGLFLENYTLDRENVMYTFSKENKGDIPSLYQLYMKAEDVVEYDFATTYFESWDHWQSIATATWMQPYIKKWRTELEIKLKAMAIKEMIREATLGGKNAFQALKFIIDKGWAEKAQGPGRGRPSKDEIRQAAIDAAFSSDQVQSDMKRLGIN